MYAFPCLNGCVNSGAKVQKVEDKCGYQIRNVSGGNFFPSENDGNRPPESCTVDEQQRKLRKKCLRAVPADKVARFSIAKIENERSNQVYDGERKTGHDKHK